MGLGTLNEHLCCGSLCMLVRGMTSPVILFINKIQCSIDLKTWDIQSHTLCPSFSSNSVNFPQYKYVTTPAGSIFSSFGDTNDSSYKKLIMPLLEYCSSSCGSSIHGKEESMQLIDVNITVTVVCNSYFVWFFFFQDPYIYHCCNHLLNTSNVTYTIADSKFSERNF